MNNTFDIKRFSLLFTKHTKEHLTLYLMSLGVMAAIIGGILGFITYVDNRYLGPHIQAQAFSVFMIIFGTVFTTLIFTDFGDKKKSIPLLTLPASHFEKFLVGWVYSYVVFQLIFAVCFYFIDFFVISIGNINSVHKSSVVNVITIEDSKFFNGLLIYGFVHAVCFAGAIFYQQWHFIKTGFTFFATVAGVVLINQPILLLIFGPKVGFSAPFDTIRIVEGQQSLSLEPTETGTIISVVLIIIVVLILWTSAYFKLKEKEV